MRIRVETCHPFALWRWSCRPIDLIPKTKSPTTIPNSLWFFFVESNPTFWPTNPTCSLRSWLDDLGVPIGWSCSPWKSYSINRSYTISIYSVYIYIIYILYILYIIYIYIYYIIYIYVYICIYYVYIYTYDVIHIYIYIHMMWYIYIGVILPWYTPILGPSHMALPASNWGPGTSEGLLSGAIWPKFKWWRYPLVNIQKTMENHHV